MDADHQRRIAHNESRYREMNERHRIALEQFHDDHWDGRFAAMCECAVADCVDMIEMSCDEYDRARANSRRFVVTPEHVLPEVEEPVEQHDHFWFIEKLGLAGKLAEALAPKR